MSRALHICLQPSGETLVARITPPDPLPVAGLLIGRPAAEVADLLGRLFNLCGAAQSHAARLALGLPAAQTAAQTEILRDHLAKFCLVWPRLLGLPTCPLPAGWGNGGAALQGWIWGGEKPGHLAPFLASGQGVAPVLAALAQRFAPGEAVADLPPLGDVMTLTAQENSPAGRVADDPLMAQAEALWGRGPLWRALGRAVDLHRLAQAPLGAQVRADGTAVVAAARGAYGLCARTDAGVVTALARVTPTDHLLAPGGALGAALASLPAAKAGLAALVIDILDPCVAVHLEGAGHA